MTGAFDLVSGACVVTRLSARWGVFQCSCRNEKHVVEFEKKELSRHTDLRGHRGGGGELRNE